MGKKEVDAKKGGVYTPSEDKRLRKLSELIRDLSAKKYSGKLIITFKKGRPAAFKKEEARKALS